MARLGLVCPSQPGTKEMAMAKHLFWLELQVKNSRVLRGSLGCRAGGRKAIEDRLTNLSLH